MVGHRLSELWGAQSSGCEVYFYSHRADPLVLSDLADSGITGKTRWDPIPAVVNVTTQKALGAASGTWSMTLKPGNSELARDLFDRVIDGDWVDIVFRIGETRHHMMRGIVDQVRRSMSAPGGVRVTTYRINGRDFGKIWEETPIWFNVYSDDAVAGSVSQSVISAVPNVLGNPEQAVRAFMLNMLERLGGLGRAIWLLPQAMPGTAGELISSLAVDTYQWNPSGYNQIAVSPSWLNPSGMLWQLGTEWSDPAFHELFFDLYRKYERLDQWYLTNGMEPRQSAMTLVFRERPFVSLAMGESSPWFGLPMYELPWERIGDIEVGSGGAERYNAYFVAPPLVQSIVGQGAIDLAPPLWDEEDVFLRGLRRFDVTSKYTSPDADLIGLTTLQREKIRDWHCLNPYMLQGTITPTVGVPEIRVGTRLRIPSKTTTAKDETYYVESIGHTWTVRGGVKSQIGVTRGWVGTDESLIDAIRKMARRYTISGRR